MRRARLIPPLIFVALTFSLSSCQVRANHSFPATPDASSDGSGAGGTCSPTNPAACGSFDTSNMAGADSSSADGATTDLDASVDADSQSDAPDANSDADASMDVDNGSDTSDTKSDVEVGENPDGDNDAQ